METSRAGDPEISGVVLAEFIRNPGSSFEQLAEKISRIKKVSVKTKPLAFRPDDELMGFLQSL